MPSKPTQSNPLGEKLHAIAWLIFDFLKIAYQRFSAWRKKRKISFKAAPWYKKILRIGFNAFLLFLLYLFLVDINFLWLFGKSPSLYSVSHPQQSEATEIYSADGVLIGKYFRENRTPVKYEEIAPIMIKTLVATEDQRFYDHFGVDIQGLFAAAKDMTQGKARGASTISQQLVKNMFKTRSEYSTGLFGYIPGIKLLIMKTKEWITAVKIELKYSKDEILVMYLNTVDFGSNAYGIKTAAKTYFNTNPKDLTMEESATLVGLLKATTTYNPRINPNNSLKRRNVVLENLMNQNIITKTEFDSIKNIKINIKEFNIEKNYDGNALYFREAVVNELEGWAKENDVDLYSDGLKIYTTINSHMQQYAEEAMQTKMSNLQRVFNNHWGKQEPWRDENNQIIPNFIEDIAKRTPEYKSLSEKFKNTPDSIWAALNVPRKLKVFDYKKGSRDTTISTMDSIRYMERFMHGGFIAIEPETGHIKAWVGDIDFNFWKYDKVTSLRQPGSTFKLFVYTAAFNKGLGPCDHRADQYIAWDYIEKGEKKHWVPRNATGQYTGDASLKYAFARSFNTVAVQLAKEVGIPDIIQTAYAMGVKTPLNNTPSTCLGSSDMSLEELVNSYCTVINDGLTQNPVLVAKIVDRDGNVIYKSKNEQKRAIPYETAFLMTQMLRAGLTEPMGTTQALWEYNIFNADTEFGGKTGTSSNHSDAWFVGVTPKLVAGAWVGGEHRCIHFRTGKLGEGSKTALPIYGAFMEKVLKDPKLNEYRAKFPKPKEAISKPYGCQTPYPHVPDSTEVEEIDPLTVQE